jgi:hypothetical protein
MIEHNGLCIETLYTNADKSLLEEATELAQKVLQDADGENTTDGKIAVNPIAFIKPVYEGRLIPVPHVIITAASKIDGATNKSVELLARIGFDEGQHNTYLQSTTNPEIIYEISHSLYYLLYHLASENAILNN